MRPFLRFRTSGYAPSVGEQMSKAQTVGQLQQCLPVLIVGPLSKAIRCCDRSQSVGRSPTTTGWAPPETASAARGSLEGRGKSFGCSMYVVAASSRSFKRTVGGSLKRQRSCRRYLQIKLLLLDLPHRLFPPSSHSKHELLRRWRDAGVSPSALYAESLHLPVCRGRLARETVNSSRMESLLQSSVQMAPWSSQIPHANPVHRRRRVISIGAGADQQNRLLPSGNLRFEFPEQLSP